MLLNVEYLPDAVVDVVVVDVLAFVALCGSHHADGNGKHKDFVKRLEHHLRDDQYGQLTQWHNASQCQREENQRVGCLAIPASLSQ